MEALINALADGDHRAALSAVKALRERGHTVMDIVTSGIQPAMERLDNKCTVEQFNLLEIMLAGRAVSAVTRELFPGALELPDPKATVVIAALEGDIHDIGKQIVRMVLIGNRYHVVDCGKDTPLDRLVDTVQRENASALCLSGLITSVIPQVRQVRPRLRAAGLDRVRVLAGGAALKQSDAGHLEVDFVGQTAFDAPRDLDAWLGLTA
jgi:methanogenic corrinoid protein MtbC1